jgi:DNA (cytosine-5)-methyltransferase 1
MAPRLLDLFCGAGGAAVGYHRAGFEVVGVDIELQPNYPFEFIQDDALDYARPRFTGHISTEFDAIHASPPCQDYSKAMRHLSNRQPRLIEELREVLRATGLPWVIENVPGAPLVHGDTLDGRHGVELCGTMFGLRVWRHRLFETTFPVGVPRLCDHSAPAMNPHNQDARDRMYEEFGRGDPEPIWREEMDVGWMKRYEAREAIPPAYTEHIGGYLLEEVNRIQKGVSVA